MAVLRRSIRSGSVHRAAVGAISAGVVGQMALLLSGVVFARLLGPHGRGDLALLLLLPAIVYQLGNLGLPLACGYFIARNPDQTAAIARRLRAVVLTQAVLLVVIHGTAIAVVVWPRGPALRAAALLTLPWTPAWLTFEYGLAVLQGQRRFLSFNVLRWLPTLTNVAAAAVLLIAPWRNVALVVAMLVVSTAVLGCGTLVFALSRSPGRAIDGEIPTLRQMAAFGAKGVLGASYPVEMLQLDQLLVGLFLSASDLGLYVVALSFINLPRFISQSLGWVAYPYVASERDQLRQRTAMWRFFWATTAITLVVVVGLEILLPSLVQLFFGEQFAGAVPISRVLLVGAVLLSARRILAEVMKGAGNPAAGSIAELM